MKKSIVLISTALVLGALLDARADGAIVNPPVDWFTGIGEGASGQNPDPTGAAWDFSTVTPGSYVIDNGALKLSLQEGDYVTLTPVDAPDTNTVTMLDVETVISAVETLPTMTEDPAQTALVVNGGKYWAWNGTAWVELVGTPTRGSVALKVELSYADMKTNPARKAIFTIGEEDPQEVTLTGAAQSAGRLTKVTCAGMTTISAINGKVELGYAKNNEVKYPTIAAAQAAAKEGEDKTVVLLRDSTEAIEADKDVAIDTNGKSTGTITPPAGENLKIAYGNAADEPTASGEVEVPLNTTADASQIDIVVNDTSKEVKADSKSLDKDNHKLTFTVWTKSTVVNSVKLGEKTTLSANETKLREFLNNNSAAYKAANTTSGAISTDLAVVPQGGNGLALWQDYVMGVEPTDSVKPMSDPSADASTEAVTLKVPAFAKDGWAPSGDYAIKYKIDNGEAQAVTGAGIPIPLPTVPTDYTVKIVLQ